MVKAKNVVFWGMVAVLGFQWIRKVAASMDGGYLGARRSGNEGNVRGGRRTAGPLGTGTLGKAEAYTDAFPEEGLGGIDPGR